MKSCDYSQHTPSTSAQTKPCNMLLKLDAAKRFGEDVCRIDDPRSVNDVELIVFDVGVNEMISYVNVLCASMRRVVGCQRKCTIEMTRDKGQGTSICWSE